HGAGDLCGLLGRLVRLLHRVQPPPRRRGGRGHRQRDPGFAAVAVAVPRPGLHLPRRPRLRAPLRGEPVRLAAAAAAHELLLPPLRLRRARRRGRRVRRAHPVGRQPADLVAGHGRGPGGSRARGGAPGRSRLGGAVRDPRRLLAVAVLQRPDHLHLLHRRLRAVADPVPDVRDGACDRLRRGGSGTEAGRRALRRLAAGADRARVGILLAGVDRSGAGCGAVAVSHVAAVLDVSRNMLAGPGAARGAHSAAGRVLGASTSASSSRRADADCSPTVASLSPSSGVSMANRASLVANSVAWTAWVALTAVRTLRARVSARRSPSPPSAVSSSAIGAVTDSPLSVPATSLGSMYRA